jgi:hypothetical protein
MDLSVDLFWFSLKSSDSLALTFKILVESCYPERGLTMGDAQLPRFRTS